MCCRKVIEHTTDVAADHVKIIPNPCYICITQLGDGGQPYRVIPTGMH